MGPQPFGCGRLDFLLFRRPSLWLQWGRNLSVAEGDVDDAILRGEFKLQWGRNLSVAEGGDLHATAPDRTLLQWGRNLSVAEGGCSCRHSRPHPALQWGRNLSVAEGVRLPVGGRMALVPLQWGRNLSVAEGRLSAGHPPPPRGRFNGAATFRLRKVAMPGAAHGYNMLQWGRNLSVAEGVTTVSGMRSASASMGPQPFGCGRFVSDALAVNKGCRFNGAATFRLRKVASADRRAMR